VFTRGRYVFERTFRYFAVLKTDCILTAKLKILLAIIVLELAALGFWFYQRGTGTPANASVGENYFTLTDTTGIDRIVLGKNTFKLSNGEWQLNERYQADKPLLRELFMLLRKVEVQQLITGAEGESLRKDLESQGQTVELWRGNQQVLSFKIFGFKGNAYAIAKDSKAPAALYIPGYSLNIYEALTLPEGEWRNKNLVSTGWLGIRSLRIRYSETPDQNIDIRRDNEFYKVAGVQQLDSAMLYRYIESYRNFRVYSFVDNPPLRDSLRRLIPFCEMEIETLNGNSGINVYAGRSGMYGITQPANELVQLEPRYFARFLVRRKDFER
jgi:muconolactone delta-isomerase